MHNSLLDIISAGKLEGYALVPQIIETTQSFVYLFQDVNKVLKVYKRDNEYWNSNFCDLSKGQSRSDFIRQDFQWNNYFNPEVYIELAQYTGGAHLDKYDGTTDELVIVMNLIGNDHFLVPLLLAGKLEQGDFRLIGELFTKLKLGLNKEIVSTRYSDLLESRCDDLVTWMKIMPIFTNAEIEVIYQKLKGYIATHRERLNSLKMYPIIDAHGENILYKNGKVGSIDIFLPMERWRTGAKELDLFRLGTDVYVLAGEVAYNEYISGVMSATNLDRTDEPFYLLSMCALMNCIQENLAQTSPDKKDVSQRYLSVMRSLLSKFGEHN